MNDTHNHLRPSSMADSEKTATHSHEPAVLEHEKGAVETVMPPTSKSEQVTVAAEEHNVTGDRPNSHGSTLEDEEDFEYPTKGRLTVITIALCLSVFCMALVGYSLA
jgi:hypothetical protein